MKILNHTFNDIVKMVPSLPPESGGIIGGTNQIITHYILDSGTNLSNGYDTYAPSILYFNETIQSWQQKGIDFYGIFHSHFPGGTELSNRDKQYIVQIMKAMPCRINHLYFPIVLPGETIIVYRADNIKNRIHIVGEDIELLI